MTTVKRFLTDDGSHSLYPPNSTESYHSTHGAIQESQHIFIELGLKSFIQDHPNRPLKLLEIGFGTGLNALLTLNNVSPETQLHYTAIEPYPIDEILWSTLNYNDQLGHPKFLMESLHHANWETPNHLTSSITLYKTQSKTFVEDTQNSFNLVYYDAFSPETAPHLWTEQAFRTLYTKLEPSSFLLTYCVKGHVKQALRTAGFTVERHPGPPGKRHCLRAIK